MRKFIFGIVFVILAATVAVELPNWREVERRSEDSAALDEDVPKRTVYTSSHHKKVEHKIFDI